jgi:ABC-type sugar transport system substrate-binding protein
MKKLVAILLVMAIALTSTFAQGSAEGSTGKESVKVGALIRNQNEQFVKDYADNLRVLAEEQGVELNLQDAMGDQAKQLDQLNTLITRGYKYFVIIPVDTSATEQMAKQIKEIGGGAAFSNIQPSVAALKVGKTFFYASSPEVVAGQFQANILDDYFKANSAKNPDKVLNLLYIEGRLGNPAQISREVGFIDQAKALGYTVNFIAKDTANWTPDMSQEKMDTWIAAHNGKFNAVIAQNDGMALGAVESLITHGLVKDTKEDGTVLSVPVIGIDGTADGLKSMDSDKLYGTVLQDSIGQSATAFALVSAMAQGKDAYGMTANGIAPATKVIDEVPANDPAIIGQCYLVPFKPITKDNYKDFM